MDQSTNWTKGLQNTMLFNGGVHISTVDSSYLLILNSEHRPLWGWSHILSNSSTSKDCLFFQPFSGVNINYKILYLPTPFFG